MYRIFSRIMAVSLLVVLNSSSASFNWQQLSRLRDPEIKTNYSYLFAVTKSNNVFVLMSGCGRIYSSIDALHWEQQQNPTGYEYFAIAGNNDVFTAGGHEGAIITSRDGKSWGVVDSGNPVVDENFAGIAYGKGLFVAVGEMARIYTSPDGLTWERRGQEQRDVEEGMYLDCVIFVNDQFIAVGDICLNNEESLIVTSPDGINWTRRSSGVKRSLWRIAYGNGVYVASSTDYWGLRDMSDKETLLCSEDGILWRSVDNFTACFNDLVFAGNRFVAVGKNGQVFQSADGWHWNADTLKAASDKNLGLIYYGELDSPEKKTFLLTATIDAELFISIDNETAATWRPVSCSRNVTNNQTVRKELLLNGTRPGSQTVNKNIRFMLSGKKVTGAHTGPCGVYVVPHIERRSYTK